MYDFLVANPLWLFAALAPLYGALLLYAWIMLKSHWNDEKNDKQ